MSDSDLLRIIQQLQADITTLKTTEVSGATVIKSPSWTLPQNLIINAGTLFEDFETTTGWAVTSSPTGGTLTNDAVHYKVGTQSLKWTTPASVGYLSCSKTVSGTLSGNMQISIYSDPANPDPFPTGGLKIYASNDSGVTQYFQYNPQPDTVGGWSIINIRTSDWTANGGATWSSPIIKLRIRFDTTNAANSYSVDDLRVDVVQQPAIVLTFDDGLDSVYNVAYQYMRFRGVRGTAYITTDDIGTVGQHMSWDQIRTLYAAGWVVGNHTLSHPHLVGMSEADQEAEFHGADLALIAQGITSRQKHAAFPYGSWDANSVTALTNLGMLSCRALPRISIPALPISNKLHLPATGEPMGIDPLSGMKTLLDNTVARGEVCVLCLHQLINYYSAGWWYINRFQSLVDYAIEIGLPFLTMEDLRLLESGAVTV